jgi:heme exporter protein B
VLHQVAPVAVLVLVLFAFALGPDRAPLVRAAPGLFWVAVLFASVLAVQRSSSIEAAEGARDGLRLSGLDPAGVFLGKAAAVAVQLVVLEVILTAGVVLLYGAHVRSFGSIIVAGLAGTAGLAAAGTLYGALAAGLRVRETLLPFLFLPVAAPVLLAGTRAWQAAMGIGASSAGDPWLRLLLVFAAVYLALGVVIFGPLQDAP